MNKKELKEILKKHKKWLKNEEDGERADLEGANLREANLARANLKEAYLARANLQSAHLYNANLEGANLIAADLSKANLHKSNLKDANLWRANLQNAYLSDTYFENTDLDLSCWPLSCDSFGAIADDKLVSQLIAHVTRLNVSKCSEKVQEAIAIIRKMPIANLFCKYQKDVKKI